MTPPCKLRMVAILENAYRDGLHRRVAAQVADCGLRQADYYFRTFRGAGIPRPAVARKAHHRSFYKVPEYAGPDWIGEPVNPWIGKAA